MLRISRGEGCQKNWEWYGRDKNNESLSREKMTMRVDDLL